MTLLRPAAAALAVLAAWALLLWTLGDPARDAAATARDAHVDARRPELLVLGNSITRTDVDPDALSSLLPGTPRTALLALDASGPDVWAVLFDRHIVRRGHTPALVVVATDPAWLLGVAAEAPRGALDDGDASVRARVTRGAVALRRTAISAGPAGAAGIVAVVHGTTYAPARAQVELAVDAWLRDPARLRADALPPPGHALDPDADPLVRLARSVQRAGGRLVVVATPSRDGRSPWLAHLREALAAEPAADFVDLSGLAVPGDGWSDREHLGPAGREALTRALAEALR